MTGHGAVTARRAQSRRLLVVIATAVVVVVADQVTTTLALEHLASGPVHLAGPLSLELAYNTGMAFSIGSGLALPIVVVVLVVVGLLVWLGRGTPSVPAAVALGAVLGGAVGNLYDRLLRDDGGAVVDFVRVGFWPTFNLADAAVVCGCVGLGVVFWRHGTTKGARPQVSREGT